MTGVFNDSYLKMLAYLQKSCYLIIPHRAGNISLNNVYSYITYF